MGVLQTYLDFLMQYAPYFYYLPETGNVDLEWGRGPAPASFAIEFLCEAYGAKEFENMKTSIYNKIVSLADYLLSIQCVDSEKLAYGGFKSKDDSNYYYTIDAMRVIPALLKAYELTSQESYLDAARLAGGTFLYNMQHKPSQLGVHDKYYGGFAQAVTIDGAWLVDMCVVDLYGLIALKNLHVRTNEAQYKAMIDDSLAFYRVGFENLYLKFSPPPYGDGGWHRTGLPENLIYDDDFSYALRGLFWYEGWSQTVKKVYEAISSIGACTEYPAYNPAVCWSGYVDVVNRKPACEYYDVVTAGILCEIRSAYDVVSLEQSVNTLLSRPENAMFWGLKFVDLTPVENKKSIVTVSWIAHLLLSYSPVTSVFAKILRVYGEPVTFYRRIELEGNVSYAESAKIWAIVNPAQTREVIIEPGYDSDDYVRIYTLSNISHRDKVSVGGIDYEVGPVEDFRFQNQLMYRTAICRRLIK
ncbi:MAG: hypothetical protein QXE76_06800 [Candidatus Bathyarchaeia archaeon]